MKVQRLVTVVAASMLLAGCSDEGPVSGPGTMTATLVGPNGSEGAAVLSLLGDDVGEISPIGTTEVYSRAGDSQTFVVLVDQNGGELSFQVAVADTTQPPAFVVQQVAGPDDALRASTDGYSLEFSR